MTSRAAGVPLQVSYVHTARIEIHTFEAVTLTDKQFLTGAQSGISSRIGGELRLPSGTARIPAVILVHGSGGIGANVVRWAHLLNEMGVAAFLLDCFTGRQIMETITDQSRLSSLTMIADAYRSLELLSTHPRIDRSRIAVMGFSKGGFAALYSSLIRFQRLHGPSGVEFDSYIAFYPSCTTTYIEDELVSDKPIRLFHGTADDYVSIEPCRSYFERLRRLGKDIQLNEYPGARHVFDNPLYSPPLFLADALTTNHCPRLERPLGEIVMLQTGEPFSWSDSCVKRGATVGFDPHATAEATASLMAFLHERFRLRHQLQT
ncbi:MAG: dienelactone hydrolase family protein [Candidatus Acidiferrum sp.]